MNMILVNLYDCQPNCANSMIDQNIRFTCRFSSYHVELYLMYFMLQILIAINVSNFFQRIPILNLN